MGFGGSGQPTHEGRQNTDDDDMKEKKKPSKFRLCITFVIVIVLMAVALAIVAIYLALRDNDKTVYTGTYEAKVRMAEKAFSDKLGDVDSAEFRKQQEEFCSKAAATFDGAINNCIVDAFSKGSLVALSSLDFDLDKLETLVKKTGSVPSEETIIATLADVFTAGETGLTVNFVRKEPKFLTFQMRTWMTTTDVNKETYCAAVNEIYEESFKDCNVTTKGNDFVKATVRLSTNKMKALARRSRRPSDITGIRSVVLKKLSENKVDFFKTREFQKHKSEVDDFSDGQETTAATISGDVTSTQVVAESTPTTASVDVTTATSASGIATIQATVESATTTTPASADVTTTQAAQEATTPTTAATEPSTMTSDASVAETTSASADEPTTNATETASDATTDASTADATTITPTETTTSQIPYDG